MGNLRHGCAIAFVHESSWEKDFHQRDMDLIGVTHTDTVLESQKEEYCHSRAPWSPPPPALCAVISDSPSKGQLIGSERS